MLLFEGHNPEVTGLAFSPDGRTLAAYGAARLEFWSVAAGATPQDCGLTRHGGPTDNVRFDPTGRWALVAAGRCGLYAVDVRTRSVHQVDPLWANAVCVSAGGRVVVATGGLTAFDVGAEVDSERKWQRSAGRGEPVKGLDFFPDGERFVTVEEYPQHHGRHRVSANIRSATDGKVLEKNGLACNRGRLVRVSQSGA
jgi:WD40 repeat protein